MEVQQERQRANSGRELDSQRNAGFPADWSSATTKLAKVVFYLRHRLQQGMLNKAKLVAAADVQTMFEYLEKLDNEEYHNIRPTSFGTQRSRRNAEYGFKERCKNLIDRWDGVFAKELEEQKSELKKIQKIHKKGLKQAAIMKVQESFKELETSLMAALLANMCDHADGDSDEDEAEEKSAMQKELRIQQEQIKKLQEQVRILGKANNNNAALMRNILEEYNGDAAGNEMPRNPFRAAARSEEAEQPAQRRIMAPPAQEQRDRPSSVQQAQQPGSSAMAAEGHERNGQSEVVRRFVSRSPPEARGAGRASLSLSQLRMEHRMATNSEIDHVRARERVSNCFFCGLHLPPGGVMWRNQLWELSTDDAGRKLCKLCLPESRKLQQAGYESLPLKRRRMEAMGRNKYKDEDRSTLLKELRERTNLWPRPSAISSDPNFWERQEELSRQEEALRNRPGVTHAPVDKTDRSYNWCRGCSFTQPSRAKWAPFREDRAGNLYCGTCYNETFSEIRFLEGAEKEEFAKEMAPQGDYPRLVPCFMCRTVEIRGGWKRDLVDEEGMAGITYCKPCYTKDALKMRGEDNNVTHTPDDFLIQPRFLRPENSPTVASPGVSTDKRCIICTRPQSKIGMWDALQEHVGKLYCSPCYDNVRMKRADTRLNGRARQQTPRQLPSSCKGTQSNHCFICKSVDSRRGWRPALVDEPAWPDRQYCFDCYKKNVIEKQYKEDQDPNTEQQPTPVQKPAEGSRPVASPARGIASDSKDDSAFLQRWLPDKEVATCYLCSAKATSSGPMFLWTIHNFKRDIHGRMLCAPCFAEDEPHKYRYGREERTETEPLLARRKTAISTNLGNDAEQEEKDQKLDDLRRLTAIWPADFEVDWQLRETLQKEAEMVVRQASLLDPADADVFGAGNSAEQCKDVFSIKSRGEKRTICFLCGLKAPRGRNGQHADVYYMETPTGRLLCGPCFEEEKAKTPAQRAAGVESDTLRGRRSFAQTDSGEKKCDRSVLLDELRNRTNVKPRQTITGGVDISSRNKSVPFLGASAYSGTPRRESAPVAVVQSWNDGLQKQWKGRRPKPVAKYTSAAASLSQSQQMLSRPFRAVGASSETASPRPNVEQGTRCSVCDLAEAKAGIWNKFHRIDGKLYCNPCHYGRDQSPSPSLPALQSDECFRCGYKGSERGWQSSLVGEPVHPGRQYCNKCFDNDLVEKHEKHNHLDSGSDSELSTPPASDVEDGVQSTRKRKRATEDDAAHSDSDYGSPVPPIKRPFKKSTTHPCRTESGDVQEQPDDSQERSGISDYEVVSTQPLRLARRSLSQHKSVSQVDEAKESEEEDDDEDATPSRTTKRLGHTERMAHNERKWEEEVLSRPEVCKQWLGMTPMTFRDIEEQLVEKGGLRSSQGISTKERLAMFLNLMTTPCTILEVARRWSPEGTRDVKTVIDAGMDVVDCLMRLAVNVVPYTQGRKGKHTTPRIPESLNGDKELWDKFNWCMGGIVHFCELKRRATPEGIESTSRVIIVDYEGMFKSVKVQWEEHAAASFSLANPPKGFVVTRFWKSFIMADKAYRHITDVDGFVRHDECSTVADGPRMSLETFTRLHAKALKPSQRTIRALKERLLRSPQGSNDTALARKVLNDHPDLVPACCVVYNIMAQNGEFDPLEAMLEQQSGDEDDESANDVQRNHNTVNAKKPDSVQPPSESEMGSDDEVGNAPSQAQAYSSKPSNLRPAERRAINDRMIKNILNNPTECMKWFGISKVSFMKVLQNLIAAGLPESAAMSKMERLALFLNLTTTGDPVLKVARRFGPRMCATVGLACNAVVQALMSLIDEVMPYTVGREHNAERLPMPDSLEGQEQIWEYFHDCLGSLVTVCAPTALRGSEIYKSTSRVIVAGWDGKFRSVEVQFKNTVAESNAERLGEGNLVADATKTFVISNFWKKAPDVDGFVGVNEGPSVDNDDITDREYKALYAKACQVCNRSVKKLKKRFLRAPDSRSDKTLARKALKKLPEMHTSLCILFNMLVDIGELYPHYRVEGYQSPDSDEDDSSSTDGDDEDDGGGDGDETEGDNGMDVTQYPDDEEEDGDVQDQIMAEAGAEAAATEAPKTSNRKEARTPVACYRCGTTRPIIWGRRHFEEIGETHLVCGDCRKARDAPPPMPAAEAEGEAGLDAGGEEAEAGVKQEHEPDADVPMNGTVDGTKVKREFRYEILSGVKHEVIDNDEDDIYN